jgi:4-hydroxyphenylpyruvate dioxygenase-like putative hemolysin
VNGAHVHHVVWCVRQESLPALQEYWTGALGVPLASSHIAELGLHLLMSWEAGVEIVAPSVEPGSFTPALEAFLDAKGEGVFSTVYEVDDLDAAVEHAVARGAAIAFEDVIEPETLAQRLHWTPDHPRLHVRQIGLVEHLGTTVVLQESRPV